MTEGRVTEAPVLVTGASGFIAGHIIQGLLARGYRVRGTVRNPDAAELRHLRALDGAERLELVAADLLQPGAFEPAARGVTHVLHTASPYTLHAKDPQRDLVEPAVRGTKSLLEACHRAGGVERVVLTSSMAAITDEPEGDRPLTEADWNSKSTLQRNPYYLSKTLAEKAAWGFMEGEGGARPGFDLVVVNPFLVVGPSLSPTLNVSNQIFVDVLSGVFPGIINLTWGMVDVRDVAEAHIRAMENRAASGRYLCAAEPLSMRALVELLAAEGYGESHKLPKLGLDCAIGDFMVHLSSYAQPRGVGSYLRTHVGRLPRFDNGKIRRELGIAFRPVKQTVLDTLPDLQRWGHLGARSG